MTSSTCMGLRKRAQEVHRHTRGRSTIVKTARAPMMRATSTRASTRGKSTIFLQTGGRLPLERASFPCSAPPQHV
eukprot:3610745-Prymnesium_polylepis.1